MPLEIERKFLVKADFVPKNARAIPMVQAYLCADPQRTVRVRIAGNLAWLTVKGGLTGNSRPEFEYAIPAEEAREMMKLAVGFPVEKVRYEIWVNGKKWEVDIFEGMNQGLMLAEVELDTENESVTLPDWVGEEVSGDMRYHNSRLSEFPFTRWE
ncbi:CYTH domain-containing protein [Gaoshiqia sediminis]|uniref:CYTH domain-containing protein n=1 Tax=Gaoshiqia sediminis TaxID=2986998 RepID=A0AA42CA53_9BACT|nr:CYTH domain-containing protein [Gaoshiqia sediminis]MCW0483035.1 CYTH domain-containing protein [Gaoshiqia sediminis]